MDREKVLDNILDSKDTTTGGGSASAIAAAMGSGLISMVARLSKGKGFALSDDEYENIANHLDKLNKQLIDGSINDTKAYAQISNAFKMPKNSDEEKQARAKAINQAGIAAATTPMENAHLAEEALKLLNSFINKHNLNANSDLIIGKRLLILAIDGLVLNIEANLSLIKDQQARNNFEKEIVRLKNLI